ncbi:MAG: UDP-glucose 4-epimerase GalE [Candidatus Marinimicrobia bacterium]|nr:UDP-glucose 4-epimerase GalE [Candidatus Neomarinimicrobiota bacterium]|tara:strand:- start:409 stop:1392 length:984 start_codon:yes stop_codon:yes gene_type:complete
MAAKTVLVTGGAGYIGSHACKALANAGYEPVVYDNLYRGHREFVKWGPFEKGDIVNRKRLDAVIAHHKPSAVMHFAALAIVSESVETPLPYYDTNVGGTATVVTAACSAGIKKFIFSGTCAVYGIPNVTPIKESAILAPINAYGRSKLMAENVLATASTAHNLSNVTLRYFNAAGADPDGEIGERHDPETHIIPNVLKVAAGKSSTVVLNGDDYPTPDGTCIRDYVHVTDIANAHVKALQYLDENPGSHVFNLGTGDGFSVRQVIETARKVTKMDIPISIGPRREGDPAILVANASRILEACDWAPEKPSLEVQISDAWTWHQKNGF